MGDLVMDVEWLDRPEDHDYDAAASYLQLVMPGDVVADLIPLLRAGPVVQFKAKDVVRATYMKPLDERNRHVSKDLAKIRRGEALSPVLLVRNTPLTVADGWHRVCALYLFDEDAFVHGVLV